MGEERAPQRPCFRLPIASSSLPSTSVFPLPRAAPNGSSPDVRFYLTVYASIAGINSLCTLLRAVLFAAGTLRATGMLHRRLLQRVLQVRSQGGPLGVQPNPRLPWSGGAPWSPGGPKQHRTQDLERRSGSGPESQGQPAVMVRAWLSNPA